jgi:hypothetical protein
MTLSTLDVIARTEDAVYLRLPKELQRPIDRCVCPYCDSHKHESPAWDTLCVPVSGAGYASTVHMPDPLEFEAAIKRNGKTA